MDRKRFDSSAKRTMAKAVRLDLAYKTLRHLSEEYCCGILDELDAVLAGLHPPAPKAVNPSDGATLYDDTYLETLD
eukprot:3377738-Lingulodinium_polyedra.AAC.1